VRRKLKLSALCRCLRDSTEYTTLTNHTSYNQDNNSTASAGTSPLPGGR